MQEPQQRCQSRCSPRGAAQRYFRAVSSKVVRSADESRGEVLLVVVVEVHPTMYREMDMRFYLEQAEAESGSRANQARMCDLLCEEVEYS